jgi:hypothetical protein
MSQTQTKNFRAKCLDLKNPDEVVLHLVEFEISESGGEFKPHQVEVMAQDPMDAIDAVRREFA